MGISASGARLSCVLGLCIALAACGGGDGGDQKTSTASPSDSTPSPSDGTSSPSDGTASPSDGTASPSDGTSLPGDSGTPANTKPTISGNPPPSVLADQQYVFQPQAEDGDGDLLTFRVANPPPWAAFDSASGTLQGTPSDADVGSYGDIVISVTDGAEDAALDAFTITVQQVANGAVELSWLAPTENEDGSPLTDLGGFKIYWGTTPGEYSDSVTIDNPGVLTYLLENLVPNTYYFVATAFNLEGTESSPSEMASATL
jgi:hypothetical protein